MACILHHPASPDCQKWKCPMQLSSLSPKLVLNWQPAQGECWRLVMSIWKVLRNWRQKNVRPLGGNPPKEPTREFRLLPITGASMCWRVGSARWLSMDPETYEDHVKRSVIDRRRRHDDVDLVCSFVATALPCAVLLSILVFHRGLRSASVTPRLPTIGPVKRCLSRSSGGFPESSGSPVLEIAYRTRSFSFLSLLLVLSSF